MSRLVLETRIRAPAERVFDLSRSIELHLSSTAETGEEVVGPLRHGLLELGQEVTWRAVHFGIRQELTSRITAYDRPRSFRDSMVRGAFKRFDHDHIFESSADGTVMRDIFDYSAPLGVIGRLTEKLVLDRYLRRLLTTRNEMIRRFAESEEWRRFLGGKGVMS